MNCGATAPVAAIALAGSPRRPPAPQMPERADKAARLQILEVLADVFPHLVVPVEPFVAAFRAPVVQVVGDTAAREHF